MVKDVLLLMTEYGAEDTPLWYRLSRENIGNASGVELGLSDALREELAAWNGVWESTARWESAAERIAHAADGFAVASRVQLELGDDTHVWCAGGDGVDSAPSDMRGDVVVLAATDRGTDIEWWKDGRAERRTASAAGSSVEAARAIVTWRSMTERASVPFGDATTRAQGLRAAGLLRRSLHAAAQVRFLAGARTPRDYELAGVRPT